MQRLTASLHKLALTADALAPNYANLQAVRWARKPIWMGTAKSKRFRVPERIKQSREEYDEMKRLNNNYRTYMNSIQKHLNLKYNVELQAKEDKEQLQKDFEADLARCNALNDEWNAAVRVHREKRVADELEAELEFARGRLTREKLRMLEKEQRADEIVRKQMEQVKAFITPDKLDQAVAEAMANPVDYNYSIDLEGNQYIGRTTYPTKEAANKQS